MTAERAYPVQPAKKGVRPYFQGERTYPKSADPKKSHGELGETMDRARLVGLLAELLPDAREEIAFKRNVESQGRGRAALGARPRWRKIYDRLDEYFKDQPELQLETTPLYPILNGATGLARGHLCEPVMEEAIDNGCDAAVHWLETLLAKQHATVRVFAATRGLLLPPGGILLNGVNIAPFDELPMTPHGLWMQRGIQEAFGGVPASAAAFIDMPAVKILRHKDRMDPIFEPALTKIKETVLAFTVFGDAAPRLGQAWTEYLDTDLQRVGAGFGYSPEYSEGVHFPELQVDTLAVASANRVLAAFQASALGARVKIATSRLNMARRRKDVSDRAIDAAICLEAILGDADRFDLTYKISLRAALLTETDVESRRQVMKKVKAFYKLRSAIVHGERDMRDAKDQQTLRDGLETCAIALRRFIELDCPNEWWRIELVANAKDGKPAP